MSKMFVSPRKFFFQGTNGRTIEFLPGVPVEVHPTVQHEVMRHGIMPVDGDTTQVASEDVTYRPFTVKGDLRSAIVLRVIDMVKKANVTADFDAGGRPKTEKIEELAGFRVLAAERNKAWAAYQTLAAEESDLPTAPNLDRWFEAKDAETADEIAVLAKELGLPGDLSDRSVKEGRKALMQTIAGG